MELWTASVKTQGTMNYTKIILENEEKSISKSPKKLEENTLRISRQNC